MLLQACLNGGCHRETHPRCPVTPSDLSADAIAAIAAGADIVHVHPRDRDGNETLEAEDVGNTVTTLRETVDVPIGVTTGAWIVSDVAGRLRAIAEWRSLPDFASVNFHEEGAAAVAAALLDRNVGVEVGVVNVAAAEALVASGLADRCIRVLLEPVEPTTDEALATVDAVEKVLDTGAPDLPRLLHGREATAWDLVAEAGRRGYDTRIGMEDTIRMPDGKMAPGNGDLVRAALTLYREAELSV